MALQGLKPEKLWYYFGEISKIPRCSKKEDKIRAYLKDVAAQKGWENTQDKAGNIIIQVPAKPGKEKSPITILQAHMDMVCEKNKATEFNFDTDPIRLIKDDDHITADGTTLGADNGIGIAAALAVADSDLQHGPLELLMTTDEETGLTGATELDASLLKGKQLINLDTEDFGYIYVGCAGGGNVEFDLSIDTAPADKNMAAFTLELEGLKGGHSGLDIHLNRGNATQMIARFAYTLINKLDAQLSCIEGGDKHNAIPREAMIAFTIDKSKEDQLKQEIESFQKDLQTELAKGHELHFNLKSIQTPDKVAQKDSALKVLNLIKAVPHGPLAMSMEIDGMVQSSNNLAVVKCDYESIHIQCSPRSSVDSELAAIVDQIAALGYLCGADVTAEVGYPGWKPDVNSQLLAMSKDLSKEMFGKEFEVTAIHAGLECGIIGAKIPGLDKISIGPDIKNPHSPDEWVSISSSEKFFSFLEQLLLKIAN